MDSRDSATTLRDWVGRAVERHSSRVALELGEDSYTYAELWERAGAVAAAMARTTRRPVRRAGVHTASSMSTYVGYLAAVRLGATVVPLNPGFPRQRTDAILRAAAPDVVLIESHHATAPAARAAADLGIATVDPAVPGRPGRADDDPVITSQDLAYILFTSGSTGRPKGVPIRHGNVLPYLRHIVHRCGVTSESRLSQTFELTFDVSVFDLFAAWGTGATLVVPLPRQRLLPADYVNGRAITHWCSVPSAVSVARRMRLIPPGAMPALQFSMFIGEQLTLEQAEAWSDAAPASAIENSYGPTELTVACAEYRLPADRSRWPSTSNGSVPIGRMYPHLEYAVLDGSGEQSEEGELCVRGSQRFAGYLDPRDDDNRFVLPGSPGPAAPSSAASYYRTGDRVRWESGELVHLGRLDQQTKIRGYRVELGEIEATVRRTDGVHDAVALVVPAQHGTPALRVVYTGRPLDPTLLDESCRQALPAYMVPDGFTHVATLPLNANGKIDRQALAESLVERAALS